MFPIIPGIIGYMTVSKILVGGVVVAGLSGALPSAPQQPVPPSQMKAPCSICTLGAR